jgi:hypothetical protein
MNVPHLFSRARRAIGYRATALPVSLLCASQAHAIDLQGMHGLGIDTPGGRLLRVARIPLRKS